MMENIEQLSNRLSEEQQKELELLLLEIKTVEDGFSALGRELGASATGEEPEKRGRVAFNRRLSELRSYLCKNPQIKKYCSDSNYADAASVAGLVAGALVASSFSGMNVVLIGCIVARLGLRKLCSKSWTA